MKVNNKQRFFTIAIIISVNLIAAYLIGLIENKGFEFGLFNLIVSWVLVGLFALGIIVVIKVFKWLGEH